MALVLQASWIVQAIMLLLLLIALASWTVIFSKFMALRRIRQDNAAFEAAFWSGASLAELQGQTLRNIQSAGPMERLFASGMREYTKLRERRMVDAAVLMDSTQRAMRVSLHREADAAEAQLSFLASVASVSPYIGLFGT
ncbi:unnamed protein product, partial [Darwinula stevensoni]